MKNGDFPWFSIVTLVYQRVKLLVAASLAVSDFSVLLLAVLFHLCAFLQEHLPKQHLGLPLLPDLLYLTFAGSQSPNPPLSRPGRAPADLTFLPGDSVAEPGRTSLFGPEKTWPVTFLGWRVTFSCF